MKFLALDSGSKKWGYAIFLGKEVKEKGIIGASKLEDFLIRVRIAENLDFVVVGRRKGAIEKLKSLDKVDIFTVDEMDTTIKARDLYFSEFPPRGLLNLLPKGLRLPRRPIDDFAAVIIGRRFLESPLGIFKLLEEAFLKIVRENRNIEEETVSIKSFSLDVCEGKVDDGYIIEVEIAGFKGRAFGNVRYKSTVVKLKDLINKRLISFKNRFLLVALLNALFCFSGGVEHTLHCEKNERSVCAENLVTMITKTWGKVKICVSGNDPVIIEKLKKRFNVSLFDSNSDEESLLKNSDLFLAFGGSLFDGRLSKFLALKRPILCCGPTMISPSIILEEIQGYCPLSK
ncbi:MAG: hypothetical protein PWQ16_685 [bacterium]|nr:hypothetical protein [bacterium]